MAGPVYHKVHNIFINLLNLSLNIARAVSGLVIGLDMFILACKVRLLRVLGLAPQSFNNFLLGFCALQYILFLGVSLIIPPASFFWVIAHYQFEILSLARFTYLLTSLRMRSIQHGLRFTAGKISQLIRDYPKLTIATIVFCGFFPGIATSLLSGFLALASNVTDMALYSYLYEPTVSLFQLPINFAKKLFAVRSIERGINFVVKSCYYFSQKTTPNEVTTLATYLKHINDDDEAYFFHNYFSRDGKISLGSQRVDDAEIAEFMQAIADNPSIAKYIKMILLQSNDISSITIPGSLISLEELNVAGNKLKRIEFADELTNLKKVLLNNNNLKEVNLPDAMLNTLKVFKVDQNPLTDATKYYLQQLPSRFPELQISGAFSSEPYIINEPMLEQHVSSLVPYSLQPPGHLNAVSKETRQNTFLLTTWMERQSKNAAVNYESALCNKIISYLYAYPITPQQAVARISKSLGMIRSSMPENLRSSDEITLINDFTTRTLADGSGVTKLLDKEIDRRFNAAVSRDVNDVVNILQRQNSSLRAINSAIS